MNLVVVESPTKAKTLHRFLGPEYTIEASMGHIRDLPKKHLGIDIEHDFEPEYVNSEGKSKTISLLKKLAKTAQKIYLATDPDREGEAISWHIQSLLQDNKNRDKFVRATFHEITKPAILNAIEHPGSINTDLINAQQARRVVDRLVGYYLSPVLWKKVRRGLSAGRVQSVALRLIVEREREIQAFVPQEYWEVTVDLKNEKNEHVVVSLWKKNDAEILLHSKQEVDQVVLDLEESAYSVQAVDSQKRKRASYPPFTTSTLQQAAANRLGFSSKKTMKLAQDLYEHGLITYHRTDSVNLSVSAVEEARNVIQSSFGLQYVPQKPRFFQTKSKNAQEAHEAIRPTQPQLDASKLPDTLQSDHQRLYDLIWRRFTASQMVDAEYEQTQILVNAKENKNSTTYLLKATGSVLLFDGWTRLFPNHDDILFPKLTQNEVLQKESVFSVQKFTQPKPRYNDASLVKTLEKLGIGRPSTYASIISVILDRGYVERLEKAFQPTSIGMTVSDFLVKNFPQELDYTFTANMEDDLDAIARGEKEWRSVVRLFFTPFEKTVMKVTNEAARAQIPVEELGETCPLCTIGKLVIRTGRFGKFVSCSRYPECTFTGKLIQYVKDFPCPECHEGQVRLKRTSRGREFFGCSRYPACRFSSWKKPGTDENPIVLSYIPNAPKTDTTKQDPLKKKTIDVKKKTPVRKKKKTSKKTTTTN